MDLKFVLISILFIWIVLYINTANNLSTGPPVDCKVEISDSEFRGMHQSSRVNEDVEMIVLRETWYGNVPMKPNQHLFLGINLPKYILWKEAVIYNVIFISSPIPLIVFLLCIKVKHLNKKEVNNKP